jgi:hypothetical protein
MKEHALENPGNRSKNKQMGIPQTKISCTANNQQGKCNQWIRRKYL